MKLLKKPLFGAVCALAFSMPLALRGQSPTGFPPALASGLHTIPWPYESGFTGPGVLENLLFIVSRGVPYRSTDLGATWNPVRVAEDSILPDFPFLHAAGNDIWCPGQGGSQESGSMLRSADSGKTWKVRPFGVFHHDADDAIAERTDTLYQGGTGVRYLPAGGNEWRILPGTDGYRVSQVQPFGSYLYITLPPDAIGRPAILRTRGYASPIEEAGNGLPTVPGRAFGAMAVSGTRLYLVNGDSLWSREEGDSAWGKIGFGFGNLQSVGFVQGPGYFGLVSGTAAYRCDSITGAWSMRGNLSLSPQRFAGSPALLAGIGQGRLLLSRDSGLTWTDSHLSRFNGDEPRLPFRPATLVEAKGGLFFASDDILIWTKDRGRTWKTEYSTASVFATRKNVFALNLNSSTGLIRYDSAQDDWVNVGVPVDAFNDGVSAAGTDGDRVLFDYDFAHSILYKSTDEGDSWTGLPAPAAQYAYSGIQAQGALILLNRWRGSLNGSLGSTGSADGGRTWRNFPNRAKVVIDQGCFFWADSASLRSWCGTGTDRATPAPFGVPDGIFSDGKGLITVHSLTGALYQCGGNSPGREWSRVAAPEELAGWSMQGEVLSRKAFGEVEWLIPQAASATATAVGARARSSGGRSAAFSRYRVDGRLRPRPGSARQRFAG